MDEVSLLEQGYKKYCGDTVDVYFNKDMCNHNGNCARSSIDIFNPKRRPWIQIPSDDREVIEIVNACPTQALKYIKK